MKREEKSSSDFITRKCQHLQLFSVTINRERASKISFFGGGLKLLSIKKNFFVLKKFFNLLKACSLKTITIKGNILLRLWRTYSVLLISYPSSRVFSASVQSEYSFNPASTSASPFANFLLCSFICFTVSRNNINLDGSSSSP